MHYAIRDRRADSYCALGWGKVQISAVRMQISIYIFKGKSLAWIRKDSG